MKTNPSSKKTISVISAVFFCLVIFLTTTTKVKAQVTYCPITSYCNEYIYNVSIGTLNNTTYCSSGGYAAYTSSGPTLWMGSSYTLSITMGNAGFNSYCNAWADWNNNGSFNDAGEQLYLTNFNTATGTTTVNVPNTGVNGYIRMRVRSGSGGSITPCGSVPYGESEDYVLFLAGAFPCSGIPAASTTLTSVNPACYAQNFTLSLGTAYIDTGITYQWQSSPDGTTWANMAGATSLTYTGAQTSATYYRCLITCTNGGLFVYSTTLFVTMNNFNNCYCTPGVTNNTNGQEITNVTFAGINNTTGAASSQGYSNFTGLAAAQVTQYSSYLLSVMTYNGGLVNYCGVWIDWNQNGLFETTEYYNLGGGNYPTAQTQTIVVPGTALAGPTRMRVRIRDYTMTSTEPCAAYTWGETEDYTVNVTAAVMCSGAPASATTLANVTTACSSTNISLSLSTAYTNAGLTFQWQTSPNGSTWTNVGGTTSQTYTTTQSATTYYQCVITCTSLSLSTVATSVMITQNPPLSCYCIPPTSTTANFMWLTNVSTTGCVANINNATPASGVVTYHDYSSTVIATQTAGLTVNMTFVSSGYPLDYAVWVDFNDNGMFTDPGELVLSINTTSSSAFTVTGSFTIPITTAGGTHRMRVRGDYYTSATPTDPCTVLGYGETEDYGLTVNPVTVCSGAPTGGTTSATATTICGSGTTTLSLTGASSGNGITYQWQQNSGSGYTNIAGATSMTYTTPTLPAPQTIPFQCVLTCTYSSLSSISSPVTINVYNNPAVAATATNATICNGDSTQLYATGANSYTWMPGNLSGFTVTVHPTALTIYTVTGTDTHGCQSTYPVTINVNPTPFIYATANNSTLCNGDSTSMFAVGALTYMWMPGSLSNYFASVHPSVTTTYTVTGTDGNGCTKDTTITIAVNPLPSVGFTQNPATVCVNWAPFNLSAGSPAGGIYSGTGITNTTTGIFSPSAAGQGTYSLCYAFTDMNGCSNSVCSGLAVDACTGVNQLGIKNEELGIYPNPTSGIVTLSGDKIMSVEISDVLGNVIFHSQINNSQSVIDLSDRAKGMYFIKVNSTNGTITKKIILQ